MLIAALVAVATWPSGDLAFWDSASGGGFGVDTAAAVGWYLALVAGAVAAAGGFLGLGPSKADAKP